MFSLILFQRKDRNRGGEDQREGSLLVIETKNLDRKVSLYTKNLQKKTMGKGVVLRHTSGSPFYGPFRNEDTGYSLQFLNPFLDSSRST